MPEGGQEADTGAGLEAGRAVRSTVEGAVGTGAGNGIAATGTGVRTVSAGVGAGAGAGIIPARGTDISQDHEAGQERPRDPKSVAGLGPSAPRPLCPRS